MDEIITKSKMIIERAMLDYKPKAVVLMFSGGDDSLTTYEVIRQLNIKIDFVIHGYTRTGIQQTTDFAKWEVERRNGKLLIADAGDAYERYVMRKGFFGKGNGAHNISYHILKQDAFDRTISKHIRQRQRNFPILFLNGARQDESPNRQKHFTTPYRITKRRPNDIWVNLINHFSKHNCLDYLQGNNVQRNPVSINLCRSGECMCGTMQSEAERIEASFFYRQWALWLNDLERKAMALHGFGWNDKGPAKKPTADTFQPMCSGCKAAFGNTQSIITE